MHGGKGGMEQGTISTCKIEKKGNGNGHREEEMEGKRGKERG